MPFPIEPTGFQRRAAVTSLRALGLAALLALPLALGGCSWLGMGGDDADEVDKDMPKPCPTVGVLDGADHITVFNGRGRDLTDVVARAEIRKAVIECEYEPSDGNISVNIAFDGQADLGPAATSREMTLKGFMTVVRHGAIKSKMEYDIPVSFAGAARTVRFLKTIDETKIPYGGELNGSAYEVLVGFQLTQDELDYNRKVPFAPLK
jgi:hypothetical protein